MLTRDDSALQALRRRHELRVLQSLMAHGRRTRRELESDTRLSRTTLSAIVGELRQRGVLVESEQKSCGSGRHGRPTKSLALNPGAGAAVGVELGHSRISVSVLGFDGSLLATRHREVSATPELSGKVGRGAAMVAAMVADGLVVPRMVVGMGVGIAGVQAGPKSMAVADGDRQPDPHGVTLDPLRAALGAPLLWDDNIRLAAMAETAPCGSAGEDLLYVVLSAGVRSATVVNGVLLGGNGMAGELGHVSVDFVGPRCRCGRRGCLERFLNATNVLAESARRGQSFDSIEAMAEAARNGNPTAGEVVDWAGELLARAVVTACALLDPGRVAVAGDLSQFGDRLLVPVRDALDAQHLGTGRRAASVATAALAPTAGSRGAALMALRRWALASV